MTTIDIAYFPHIFDAILESADLEALLALRLTCRDIYERISDEWSYVQWNVGEEHRKHLLKEPDVAYNKRGVEVPCNSPCLRLAQAVDLIDENYVPPQDDIPSFLRPEIVRCFGIWPSTVLARAKTLIFYEAWEVCQLNHTLSKPVHDRINMIYHLHFPPEDGYYSRYFDGLANCHHSTDVYILLTGVDPSPGCEVIETLFESMVCSLADEVKAKETRTNFYLVDVPSWFDGSYTSCLEDDLRRLDHTLTSHVIFETYLFSGWDTQGEDGCFYSTTQYLAEERAAACERLSQVRCITRSEMRQQVGDKAYDLTFAPRDLRALRAFI
ncbi:hypothetical protein A1Q2_03463 [Trichosporon asahii var. asahii CBS 8904]|uniref:Uncharacterized protein n=2 Tax=Trichosporon asahii var. asahii TaxID=189963 RepID=K1VZM4_TRIAC|nr:hypothetical protein A1Q1_00027 [Trichosporon asahii var. asahii CBS 2479]EJT53020.1 hypothetical protein A1Q1_00027 [Trichosporon asahii var. asahii CBS 2479]EKD02243.1 hypothetical protein A1Q2_03463 [Trichosporon asahii var. asahii CBS 8904]